MSTFAKAQGALRKSFAESRDLYEKLTKDGVFEQLEAAGRVMLCDSARTQISLFVMNYRRGAEDQRTHRKKIKTARRVARELEATATQIAALLNLDSDEAAEGTTEPFDFIFGDPNTLLPAQLREMAHRVAHPFQAAFGPGRPTREEDDLLIKVVAQVYAASGGRDAVAPHAKEGPFADFLRIIWELLPSHLRIKNVETFIRRAQKVVLEERKLEKAAMAALACIEPDPYLCRLMSEMADSWKSSMAEMHARRGQMPTA